jgi:hypothetical protein
MLGKFDEIIILVDIGGWLKDQHISPNFLKSLNRKHVLKVGVLKNRAPLVLLNVEEITLLALENLREMGNIMDDPIYSAWTIPMFGLVVVSSLLFLIICAFLIQFALWTDSSKRRLPVKILVIMATSLLFLYSVYRLTAVAVTVLRGPELVTAQLTTKIEDAGQSGRGSSVLVFEAEAVLDVPKFGRSDQIVEGGCYHTIFYRTPNFFKPVLYRRVNIIASIGVSDFSNPLVLQVSEADPELCSSP